MSNRIFKSTLWGLLALWCSVACAQTRSTSSSGSSSSGATQVQAARPQSFSNNTTSATSGTAGSTATGGASQMTGSTGRTATQNRAGSTNQPQFNAGDGSVGSLIGRNAFVGQGDGGFIGARDASQMANQDFSPQFSGLNDPSTSQRRASSGAANIKRARPQQRISFVYPKANLVRTQVEISARFKRLKTVSGADTSISDEGVATLTGVVVDEDARKLAEALARLEPGVRSVNNQLQVGQSAP